MLGNNPSLEKLGPIVPRTKSSGTNKMKWQVNQRRTLCADRVYKNNLVLDISTLSISPKQTTCNWTTK